MTITLYSWSFPSKLPGVLNSVRISILKAVPIIPAQIPRTK